MSLSIVQKSRARVIDNPALLSVIVPTRNEEANIVDLTRRLDEVLSTSWRWELIVVDDSSDDTPARVEDLGRSGLPVRLLHRQPAHRTGGLGSAVLMGFSVALGDVIVVMDADLQHPPERLPLLAEIVAHGDVDVAIGSRFVVGGVAGGLDGLWRVLFSQGLRWLTRLAVPKVRGVRDPLSGFFAVRRTVLERGPTHSEGFKILLDVLVQGSWSQVVEVPYAFGRRAHGTSKASAREGLALLRQLVLIRQAGVLRRLPAGLQARTAARLHIAHSAVAAQA
ncbi:MAG: dolichol-phosphate mannosyltransferase [Acidimicrobiaceae bacterium]|nr:dolichol-phosphate mannosyltransferase [Acidimicrobiaceae bacterium]